MPSIGSINNSREQRRRGMMPFQVSSSRPRSCRPSPNLVHSETDGIQLAAEAAVISATVACDLRHIINANLEAPLS